MFKFSKPFVTRSLPAGYSIIWTVDHPFSNVPKFFINGSVRVWFFTFKMSIEVT